MDTPTGLIEYTVDGDTLICLHFVERSAAPRDDASAVGAALRRYFAGDVHALDDVAVRFDEGTPFQQEVWHALRTIPAGETISYAELARRVGRPTGFRAVGGANGRNPVAVVVPCHRVINADGGLGGYRGGLDHKRWLLRHEGVPLAEDSTAALF